MATVHRFEDLEVWQKARQLTQLLFNITAQDTFRREYWLRSQIRRASTSVMANIAEGFLRHSDKEFRQFLYIARGSCAELQSHLYVVLDQKFVTNKEFAKASIDLDHVSRMLSNLIKHLTQ